MTRPLIFGILNVTADSFSDGGKFLSPDNALQQAHLMVSQGADVIDIGGESTRPGAVRVSAEEEQARVLPIIKELIEAGISVSLDTMRAETAAHGIKLGVDYINDVSGGKADADMFDVVRRSEVDYIAMHWRGHSDVMNSLTQYEDVTEDVLDELAVAIFAAQEAGIQPSRIIMDPGFGFAKDAEHNWQILRDLEKFTRQPHRVLVGVSRKRFLADVCGDDMMCRDDVTASLSMYAARQGAWAVRVHDVAKSRAALDVFAKLKG